MPKAWQSIEDGKMKKHLFAALLFGTLFAQPLAAWSFPRVCTPLDIAIDPDRDCLSTDEEIAVYRSDPNVTDSDFDGLCDGDEVYGVIDPFFTIFPSNPRESHSDSDGLTDGMEAELNIATDYVFNPNIDDTDGDGVNDFDELFSHCGNGLLDENEACDDGNSSMGDACNNFCVPVACGNGVVEPRDGAPGEQCDDAGFVGEGDTCDNECRLILPYCQDGIVNSPAEQCDDGNGMPGDACNAFCQREICGNRTLDVGEQCDDGNAIGNDGCDSSCRVEVPAVDPSDSLPPAQPNSPEGPTAPASPIQGSGSCSLGLASGTGAGMNAMGLALLGLLALVRSKKTRPK